MEVIREGGLQVGIVAVSDGLRDQTAEVVVGIMDRGEGVRIIEDAAAAEDPAAGVASVDGGETVDDVPAAGYRVDDRLLRREDVSGEGILRRNAVAPSVGPDLTQLDHPSLRIIVVVPRYGRCISPASDMLVIISISGVVYSPKDRHPSIKNRIALLQTLAEMLPKKSGRKNYVRSSNIPTFSILALANLGEKIHSHSNPSGYCCDMDIVVCC